MSKTAREILEEFARHFAYKDEDGHYWGHDTDMGNQKRWFTLAEQYSIDLPPGTKDARKLLRNAVDPKLGLHVFEATRLPWGLENTTLTKQEVLL